MANNVDFLLNRFRLQKDYTEEMFKRDLQDLAKQLNSEVNAAKDRLDSIEARLLAAGIP